MASVGQVIDDKYEILKLIGQGGMSRVYLAMDKRLNKQWAIKEIEKRAKDKNNEIVIQSAIAEANLIKQLDHPAIVRIVDIIDNGDVIYIIEDYIEGETLSSVLETQGAQPQELVIEWAMQICEALEYLHTRKPPIIYRDMKPANVMIKPDGNIKVIDFGIAREYKDQSLADTVSLGTKGYAAPEQFGGKGQTDARTDVYCLGVTLYHLLTGQNPCEPPYEIYPIRHWNPQLSAGLEAIIQKCTQLNPDDRYQSCAELLYALHHYEEYGAAYRARQKRKLNSFILTACACVLFLIVGVLGLFMRTQTNNADYTQNILQAEKASTTEEKLSYYSTAVDIKPLVMDAYLGMVDAVKDDAAFTTEEETVIKKKLNANIASLRGEEGYANLAFEVGKLYWYYYDYGKTETADNQITRMKSAIQWFEDAVEYGSEADDFYTMAKIYSDIGKFNRDITLNIEEASDKGKYSPYWSNMQELVEMISSSNDENEIIELEVYKLTMYSIETYARKFKADGITQDQMNNLFATVKAEASEVSTTSDKTEQLKTDVMNRFDAAQAAIENAFRE
ncbi:MAG: serine/threonine-protein kinase [Bacteroidales bacterium]|nr:serine/threonine-protein kinase [Bacteroidales bacterium]